MMKDERKKNKEQSVNQKTKEIMTIDQKYLESKEKDVADTPNYHSDYDDIFKSMKYRNINLFIPVINESFGTNYTRDDKITILSSEGDITKMADGEVDIYSRTSDFIIKIRDELYMLECQSYNDGTMAIRIAEYAFIFASRNAVWENGRVTLRMPNYRVIYVKCNTSTPVCTQITYTFPDGQTINYDAKNVIIEAYSKEEILKKDLYPYIPYYILRYEKELKQQKISLEMIEQELYYFLEGMQKAVEEGKLDVFEMNNIKAFTNKVIDHIVNGEKRERLVKIMGGSIITTEADMIHDAALEEGISIGRSQGISQGMIKALLGLVDKGIIDIDIAAEQAGLSKEEFLQKAKELV